MARSEEEFVEERRRGFVTGLAVSELMLLILFALLLFLVEGRINNANYRDVIDNFGGKDVAEDIGEAVGKSSEFQRILREDPEIIDLWITLTTSGALEDGPENREVISDLAKSVSELEQETGELEAEVAKLNKESADLVERLAAANRALMEGVRKGGTTLCTYGSPTTESPRPHSVPLGVVLLENDGVTLLLSGYEAESLIDAYGEVIDPLKALEVMEPWDLSDKITFVDFERINSQLISIGDNYATESRQNCRYYFDYYFKDIEANNLDLWNRLNYSGVKISTDRFIELQSRPNFN